MTDEKGITAFGKTKAEIAAKACVGIAAVSVVTQAYNVGQAKALRGAADMVANILPVPEKENAEKTAQALHNAQIATASDAIRARTKAGWAAGIGAASCITGVACGIVDRVKKKSKDTGSPAK